MHDMTPSQWMSHCRDISECPTLARDVLLSAPAGILNRPMVLALSDNLVLAFARMLQAPAIAAFNEGVARLRPDDESDYLTGECLRTILSDARIAYDRREACYNPPADYEAGKTKPAGEIDFGKIADLRGQLTEAWPRYMMADSIITSPGKFSGEHIAAVVYHAATLDGCHNDRMWTHDGLGCWNHIIADATDCAMWPDLGMHPGDAIEIRERDDGFLCMAIIPATHREARESELDALCYPEESTDSK